MSDRLPSAVNIQTLLRWGEARGDAAVSSAFTQLGLFCADTEAARTVATAALLGMAGTLPNEKEAVAAVFACEPVLRGLWLSVVSARLKEAGGRRDSAELCHAIDPLAAASETIRELLPNAKLQPTGYAELETELFGAPAEQAVVWPKLLRVIGATADLVESGQGQPAESVPAVEPLDALTCWRRGRILQLPRIDADDKADLRFVLTGSCGPLVSTELVADDSESQAVMRWVLLRPWLTLLAQVVFVQEAWLAEQISGRLALELADDQLSNPYEPSRVDVVVTTADGDEILCGTLGDLVHRVLARLDVTLLARPEQSRRLDEWLAPVIHLLLEKKVWRFDPRGGGSGRPGFVIDDEFSTSCYRAFGSKYFYRGGSVLTNALRLTCEQWAREKLSEAGRSGNRTFGDVLPEGELV